MIAGSKMTNVGYRRMVLLAAFAVLALSGCKRRETEAARPPAQTASDTEIASVRDALTRAMTAVAFDKLTEAHLGRRCVVTTRTPQRDDPPPPPLGMVRRMGAATIYTAELHELSPGGLKLRATYPTSGNAKIIEIPREDIQSIHIAP